MDTTKEVLQMLGEVLGLGDRALAFNRSTALLGAVPELDSMAVVSLLTSMEERFDIVIHDDDLDGGTFATVGSLVDFVTSKVAA